MIIIFTIIGEPFDEKIKRRKKIAELKLKIAKAKLKGDTNKVIFYELWLWNLQSKDWVVY